MLSGTYSPGDSFVHKTKPLVKVLLLAGVCTFLFLGESWLTLGSVGLILSGLFLFAGIAPKDIFAAIKPALWVLVLIFLAQLYLANWQIASFVVLRFSVMIMAASLLTLTTKTSDLIEGLENGLGRFCSVRTAESVGLAFSLCFRFIPLVRNVFEEVKEAQKARNLERSWRALVTPTIVRILKSADEISQAIVARSVDETTTERKQDES
jgi:biotin transport system permease protein